MPRRPWTEAEVGVIIERLHSNPEWIRQIEETVHMWDRQMAAIAEGDEAAEAEFRADVIDVKALRKKYNVPQLRTSSSDVRIRIGPRSG